MKKIILIAIAILPNFQMNAQTPNWGWAKQEGSNFFDQGTSITTDQVGNVLIVGSANGVNFLEKRDSGGDLLWSKNLGEGTCVKTDSNGNIYVTGNFSGSLALGSTTLNNSGMNDLFIAKYDSIGNLLWAKKIGGSGDDFGYSLSLDKSGYFYLGGISSSSSLKIGNDTLYKKGVFVAKFDLNGNEIWARGADNNNQALEWDCGVAADSLGNVILAGNVDYSPIIFGGDTLSFHGENDIFIVKFDANGNIIWAKGEGGNSTDLFNSLGIDDNGNTYITGYFRSSSITFGNTTLANQGYVDMYVVKYDPNGNALWAKSPIGPGDEIGNEVITDPLGNIYVIGLFDVTVDFGGNSFTADNGSTDIFVVKYDSNGNTLWSKVTGGSNGENGFGIARDTNENLYITGFFKSSPITLGSTTLNSAGWTDVLIAKLQAPEAVGIKENSTNTSCQVFPNPTGNLITLSYKANALTEITVTICNEIGQPILKKTFPSTEELNTTFNLSQFGKGIYFIQVLSGEAKEVRKIVIE